MKLNKLPKESFEKMHEMCHIYNDVISNHYELEVVDIKREFHKHSMVLENDGFCTLCECSNQNVLP